MRRHELTDEQFKKIEHILPGREGHVGVTAKNNRIFINGVLWIFKKSIVEMVRREKRLKNWCRKWKLKLIEGFNPAWRDLYADISS